MVVDMPKPPRKERHEIGLSDPEVQLIKEIAISENRAFAEVLSELVRAALPIKLESVNKIGVFRKLQKRDRLYQQLVDMSESDLDKLLQSLKPGVDRDA